MSWRSSAVRQPGPQSPGTDRSHRAGVDRALVVAGMFWAAVAPTIQCILVSANSHDLDQLPVVVLAFGVHACVWVLARLKRISPASLLLSWALIGVSTAAQATDGTVELLRAALNIGISISILAGLLLRIRAALWSSLVISLTIAASLGVSVAQLTSSTWSYLVLLPLNSVASACAAGVAVRELRSAAAEADLRTHARFTADRTLARKELEAVAGRRRARVLHDTVVNTLGAIATGLIVSEDAAVARRCTDDVRAVDEQRLNSGETASSIDDLAAAARTMGIELRMGDAGGLRLWLAELSAWQVRGVLSTLREAITNVAKHAQVTQARVEFCPRNRHIVVTDAGSGMTDVGPVQTAMTTRADDAGLHTTVSSAPGRGTVVTIKIPPPAPATGDSMLERASYRMAAGISAVMLAQFAAVILVTTTLRSGWSLTAVTPALALWLIVAATLVLLLWKSNGAAGLPIRVVSVTCLALAAGMVVYGLSRPGESACGVHPNLGWGGDAAAAICAVLVLLDGRVRAVAPALAIITVGSFVVLFQDAERCGGSTVALLIADALVVAAFVVLRRQVRKLSDAVTAQISDEMQGRRQQEQLAAETAIRSGGFDSLIDDARALLGRVSQQPPLIRDPDIRAEAALEESYLRALIGLPYESGEITEAFVEIIDAAKRARVRIEINLEGGVLDPVLARSVSTTVVGALAACAPGDAVTVGVFRSAGRGEMILVGPPHVIKAVGAAIATSTTDAGTDVRLAHSDGLVEIRW
ncbi:hypothetical protein BH11ACT6_BH11ACT6_41100 [soil metagenome]